MASARIDKGFKYHVWPKNNEVEHRTIFIYLFVYLFIGHHLTAFGIKMSFFFLNTEVVLKSGGSLNMLLI